MEGRGRERRGKEPEGVELEERGLNTKVSSTQPRLTSNPIISKCVYPLLMVDGYDVLVDAFWRRSSGVWRFLIHPFDQVEGDLQVWKF